jgi:RNA polymerase sigma-70 factor, ECF subfamily
MSDDVPDGREPASARKAGPDLLAAREGDAQAFDRLVRPMLGKLLALARRLTLSEGQAEELLQEALIRSHRALPGFRMECSFRSWIFSILYRLASAPASYLLKRAPRRVALDESMPDRLDMDPFTRVSARDLLRRVEASMERLPLRQRTALHLRSVEGWSYAEIAIALESSEGSMRNAVMQARRSLRERLGDLL